METCRIDSRFIRIERRSRLRVRRFPPASTPNSKANRVAGCTDSRLTVWIFWRNNEAMKDTSSEDRSPRTNKTLGNVAERIEKECNEVIRYLNDEVVPAVRQHSTKALRTAAEKLEELANYMEQHSSTGK
jgi:hypothetical protein